MTFQEIVENRRSIRRFDAEHVFDHGAVKRSLELAILSPNSSNLQLWEFHRIKSTEKRKEFANYCLGQGAAATASELVVFVSRLDHWKKHADWNLKKVRSLFKDPENPDKREKRGLEYYGKIVPFFYHNFPPLLKTFVRFCTVAFLHYTGKPVMWLYSKKHQEIIVHKSTALAAQTFMLAMKNEGYDTCPMEGFNEKKVKKALNLPFNASITMIVGCGKGLPEGITNPRWRLPLELVVFEH